MELTQHEKDVLRSLAEKYMTYALDSINGEKLKMWLALNRGEMIRPMVMIDQIPWNELNADGSLTNEISGGVWRDVETNLRQKIYQWEHFPVDLVLNPYIDIPLAVKNSGYGLLPDTELHESDPTNSVRSMHFTNLINSLDDVEKISDMHITHDTELSRRWLDEAHELFDGIAPVVQSSDLSFHLGIWDYISQLMSVEQVYFDIIDRPELLHALMNRLTESTLNGIREANELGVHADKLNICHCSHVFTEELLPDCGQGKGPQSANCWAFGLAQLFTSVRPAVTEEFELPYISRMAEQFGAIYYGCCDRLDDRLDIVKRIPNVRKVSCSPWSKRDRFAENIGDKLVMSNKPNPAFLAAQPFDIDVIEKDLQFTLDVAYANGVNLEIILKDISTVLYEPDRLTRWADTAMRLVQK